MKFQVSKPNMICLTLIFLPHSSSFEIFGSIIIINNNSFMLSLYKDPLPKKSA